MKTYRITICNDISKKKRRVNVKAHKMEGALEYASYHIVRHVVEEVIKIERWGEST